MIKYIIQFSFVFSILILMSCSQTENPESQESQGSEKSASDYKPPKEEIPYPEIFSDMQVPVIDGAYILQKKKLTNTKNKIGMQVWERTNKSFEDVKAYYLDVLEKNGWERKTDADKQSTPEQERDEAPVKYFVTKFHKEMEVDKKRFVMLINVTSGNEATTTIIKIIKEM